MVLLHWCYTVSSIQTVGECLVREIGWQAGDTSKADYECQTGKYILFCVPLYTHLSIFTHILCTTGAREGKPIYNHWQFFAWNATMARMWLVNSQHTGNLLWRNAWINELWEVSEVTSQKDVNVSMSPSSMQVWLYHLITMTSNFT